MNADELLRHYERIADAPDALPRLRQLVLDLAVRGKLLPQQPGDRPQGDALVNARKELSERAKATGRLRFALSAPIGAEEVNDQLPKGWVAARVNDTGLYINGLAFKPSDWKTSGLPIIRIQNLSNESREFNYAQGEFPDEVLVRSGDILVSWSATLDAYLWKRQTGVLNQHIFRVIQATGLAHSGYLLMLLKRAIRDLSESVHAHGLVMTHINRGPFLNHVVWIPPLAEQHRIVAKVDQLMALCDRLEAARAEREAARDRLTSASLGRLNTPDVETFGHDARFALDALKALTARADQIKPLRQAILQLAMRGKLSPQQNWSERPVRLGTVAALQNGYAFKSEWFAKAGIKLLRNANVSHGVLDWSDTVYLDYEQAADYQRFRLQEGDIVLSLDRPFIMTGTKVASVAAIDLPALLLQRVGRFVITGNLEPEFLLLWIKSPLFTGQIDPGRSNGVPHISSKQVEAAEIFLPPREEQSRLVKKVNSLMVLCDGLEASLSTGDDQRRRVLEALVHKVLEPAEETTITA